MYTKCECLRWLLIDEGSSAGCEVLGIMESNLRQHIRDMPDTYKMRPRKDLSPAECRPWGGLNMLVFVDFWQLPPVLQTAIFHNPFIQQDHKVTRIMDMFWNHDGALALH
jgi:hypothetical protein